VLDGRVILRHALRSNLDTCFVSIKSKKGRGQSPKTKNQASRIKHQAPKARHQKQGTKSKASRASIEQTSVVAQLREHHGEKLVPARKASYRVVAGITFYTPNEIRVRASGR
jgi:hypothetical protein